MPPNERPGNVVSEWFGQRIYPTVRLRVTELTGENGGICPFLSRVLHEQKPCVKNVKSKGVCTISSVSNGPRQDWLVCPYRVISSTLVTQACQKIFNLNEQVEPVPVSLLQNPAELAKLVATIERDGVAYVFFQDKLGGEISVLGTPRSPELAFDVTVVEIRAGGETGFTVARYGILELQTMDYHGSYGLAVKNMQDALRLHEGDFAALLKLNQFKWAGADIEGPNIANVFKRTFYQMLLKFRLAGEGSAAAGTVLAIPQSVWDSWQPFLGAPDLEDESPGIKRLRLIPGSTREAAINAFICVFDLDSTSRASISPVIVRHFIRISPERMAHHAFTEVPANILHAMQTDESVLTTIKLRLAKWWPAFKGVAQRRKPYSADRL